MNASPGSPLFDHLPVGIYRTTPCGRILAANRTMVDMLGYGSFDALAAVDLQRGAAHASYTRDKFRELLEEFGELRGVESVWIRADGTSMHGRESVRAIRGHDDRIEYYEGVLEHLPATPQAVAPRVASADAMLCVDPNGRVLTINAPFIALYNLGNVPSTLNEVLDVIATTLTPRSAAELDAFRCDPELRTPLLLHDTRGRAVSVISWEQRAGGMGSRAFSFRDVTASESSRAEQPRPFIDLLSRAAKTMLSARDANQFLGRVLAAASDATHAPFGVALFATADGNTFRVASVTGEPVCGPAGSPVEANDAIAEVSARGIPVIIDAAALGPAALQAASHICIAPLVVDGTTSGLLCLGINDFEAFRTDDLSTLAAFATIAAIALDRWTKFEHLAASEAKYRALADIGGTIVYDIRVAADGTLDPNWRPDNIRTITGVESTPLRNFSDFEQFVTPEDRPAITARWESLRRGETDVREWRVLAPNGEGELRWVEDCARALEREPDGSMRIVGGARDITTLKTAELALRESEEHLRVVVEAASDPMVMTDGEGSIIFTNGAVQRVFGYDSDDLSYRPLRVLIPEAPRGEKEVVGVTRDGRELPLDVSVGHLSTTQGVRSTWILRDASARKAEAQQQEVLTRVLQSVAREWVATFDAVDSPMLILEPDLTIRRLNRAARDLFGANYGQLVGRALDELATGDPWASAAEVCRAAGATNRPQTAQLRDGRTRKSWDIFVTVGEATVFPRQEKFLILNLRDVSRVVDLQEANRRSELLAVLGSIVGGVAHEVRNPLFAISATLEAFEKELEGRNEFDEYVAIFKGELARLSKLMKDLLEFGKPSMREHVDGALVDTIYAARQQCIASMQARGVRVEVETSGNPTISMDDHRMIQLFKNLIENAVQHSPAGATVDVRAYYEEGSPYVQCQVLDRGSGFAPADLPRAFEPFFSRRSGGTGLGLSLVQRIVEEHRGSILIANSPGGGAIVDMVFPVAIV